MKYQLKGGSINTEQEPVQQIQVLMLVFGMRELSRYSSVDWNIYLTDEPQLIDNDSDEENVTEEQFY